MYCRSSWCASKKIFARSFFFSHKIQFSKLCCCCYWYFVVYLAIIQIVYMCVWKETKYTWNMYKWIGDICTYVRLWSSLGIFLKNIDICCENLVSENSRKFIFTALLSRTVPFVCNSLNVRFSLLQHLDLRISTLQKLTKNIFWTCHLKRISINCLKISLFFIIFEWFLNLIKYLLLMIESISVKNFLLHYFHVFISASDDKCLKMHICPFFLLNFYFYFK